MTYKQLYALVEKVDQMKVEVDEMITSVLTLDY